MISSVGYQPDIEAQDPGMISSVRYQPDRGGAGPRYD